MANLKNDPAVLAIVEKETARAVKQATAAAVRTVKAVTATHVDFHAGSKDIVNAVKNHAKELVSKLKGGGSEE